VLDFVGIAPINGETQKPCRKRNRLCASRPEDSRSLLLACTPSRPLFEPSRILRPRAEGDGRGAAVLVVALL